VRRKTEQHDDSSLREAAERGAFAESMKRLLIRLAIGSVLLLFGFVGGRLFQHAKTGFHFKVLAEKQYGSAKDPVHWRCVSESVGMPFLDPGTTTLEYRGRTIYKAQRIFQESVPVAANVSVLGQQISWDDGELRFHLSVEEMKKGEQQDGAANGSQPFSSETNRTSSAAGSRR
jgi:hypothetical protein